MVEAPGIENSRKRLYASGESVRYGEKTAPASSAVPTTVSTGNNAASVRARLLRIAREQREDFQLVLTRYANQRLLFRLASSKYASAYVPKGAALFTI